MSNEPGFNLTALLVADRNAKAAVADAKAARAEAATATVQVTALQRAVVQLQGELAALRVQVVVGIGSGPTEAD